jgi:hypothetical protein
MRLFAFAVAFATLTFSAWADFKHLHDFEVGQQPAESFYYDGYYHVFCLGQDANYNGVLDEGDEYPSWWKIPVHTGAMKTEKVMDFPMGGVQFNTRHAFDSGSGTLYLSQGTGIVALNLGLGTVKDENVYTGYSGSLSLYSSHLFIAVPGAESKIEVISTKSKNKLFDVPAGINLMEVLPYMVSGEMGFVALNNGPYGVDSSNVMIYKLNHQGEGTTVTSIDTIYVGNTGNHINIADGKLYVTVNGSHEVKVIDLKSKEITKSIATGTEGWNGPRQSRVHGNTLYVTTYNEDLRAFDLTTGEMIDSYELPAKGEGIDISNNIIAVCNISNADYTPNNSVSFFQIATSVAEESLAADIKLYPNPVTDRAELSFSTPAVGLENITIYNIDGIKVADVSTDIAGNSLTQISIDCTEFAAGTYVLHLKANNTIQSIPFVVIK